MMDLDAKTIIAGLGIAWGVGSTAMLGWLSKSFASKGKVDELAKALEDAHQRLAAGENRFIKLEGSIREVKAAAEDAKDAAEKAEAAADKVHGVEVEIATLNGALNTLEATLKPIERFNNLMIEGHLKLGDKG